MQLYVASDKYDILSMKRRCSSFLKENLCPTKACDVLELADLHQDDDLKSSVQDYILKQWSPTPGPRTGTGPWIKWYQAAAQGTLNCFHFMSFYST
ncbi:hypothetical protein AVEN_42347-1 [Araneus ventricosus]|uniref:BTB domain-containing protein n=1 Tax=Araneus ventricosus TaxID=182803 RepID=A0A4Y2JMW8_ARAVE|nr:hypothetical protein AVEN_42347-1 [Araneus ventricosus]